jgi:hypothetical protein
MSIQYCESFLLETVLGIHDFSTDVFKAALYTNDAVFSQDTTAYSATNEIPAGNGYTAGGLAMSLVSTYPKMELDGAAVRFQTLSWVFTAQKASVRHVLIYNSSKANRAVLSVDMGRNNAIFGTFNFTFPLAAPPIIWQKAPGIAA